MKQINQWWAVNIEGVRNVAYRNKEEAEKYAKEVASAHLITEIEPIDVIEFEPVRMSIG